MRFPRMTTRRWMLAVALCACVLFLGRAGQDSLIYRARLQKAEQYAAMKRFWLFRLNEAGRRASGEKVLAPTLAEQIAVRYAELEEKYRRAALRPWLPVEPEAPRRHMIAHMLVEE